jgi:ABC-type lipoprotein release transport system permease subunit
VTAKRLAGNIAVGLRAVLKKPWRSMLVLQGVVWGVALMIFPAALRDGRMQMAREKAVELHLDHLSLESQAKEVGDFISLEDFRAVEKEFVPGRVVAAAPLQVLEKRRIEADGRRADTAVIRTFYSAQEARNFRVARGRYINEADAAGEEIPCVLEAVLADELFPGTDPLGKTVTISIALSAEEEETRKRLDDRSDVLFPRHDTPPGELGKIRCVVVGVMERRSAESLSTDDLGFSRGRYPEAIKQVSDPLGLRHPEQEWKYSDRCVHLAIDTKDGGASVDWIVLKAADAANTIPLRRDLLEFFARRSRKVAVYGNVFYPWMLETERHTYQLAFLAIFLVCIAMSGMAIVIVMLIGVLERSKEIAVRRVEGATRGDIRMQFLAEGGILCLLGGLLGLPGGILLAHLAVYLRPGLQPLNAVAFPFSTAFFTLGGAVAVGLLAALLPAARAAKLEPAAVLSKGG